MPAIDGSPQNSREYSPHLYEDEGKGKFVGNPLAAEAEAHFNKENKNEPTKAEKE